MQRPLPPNRLRELRNKHDLELYDISARFRVATSTVQRWETGESRVPDEVKLELAELYGVSAAVLMGWEAAAA